MIELKMKIIQKYDSSIKISETSRMCGKSPSRISSVVVKSESVKGENVAKGMNVLTKQRLQTIEDVEDLLLIWINKKQFDADSFSEYIICENAWLLYSDINPKLPWASASLNDFKAGRGCFEKMKRRTVIQSATFRTF